MRGRAPVPAASIARPSQPTLTAWRRPNAMRRGRRRANCSIGPVDLRANASRFAGRLRIARRAHASAVDDQRHAPNAWHCAPPRARSSTSPATATTIPAMKTDGKNATHERTGQRARRQHGERRRRDDGREQRRGAQPRGKQEADIGDHALRLRRSRAAPLRNGFVATSARSSSRDRDPGTPRCRQAAPRCGRAMQRGPRGFDMGRSVRPIEPANRQSPTSATPCP